MLKKSVLGNASAKSLDEAFRCSDKEKWRSIRIRDIPEYSEYYEVSSYGRVRSKSRIVTRVNPSGKVVEQLRAGKLLKQRPLTKDYRYHMIRLKLPGGEHFSIGAHQLVALAFVKEGRKGGTVVLHKDDNPGNNHYKNLQWGTQQDNVDDRNAKGRQAKGSNQGSSKLTEKQVRKIKKLLRQGMKHRDIADLFSISYPIISRINTGKLWKHVA
jgi:hypothetical protein